MTLEYISKLGLKVCPINIEAKKIVGSTLKIFKIILASFQVEDRFKKLWFF